MHEALKGLEPEPVWRYFDRLRQIPRCSKHEEKASQFVQDVAKELGLEYRVDENGNVVIIKPATPGYEDRPPVCLQAHLDMVCEKNSDVDHDFSKDPIELAREGDYITAVGTTLGADNGMGVATLLAIAESKELEHPKLELLFTVDEETGMTGAFNMKSDFIESRRLINVDSEEEGSIYIGCAGGGDTELYVPLGEKSPLEGGAVKITLKGLKGGHSGVDIHLGRANAIKSLARALWAVAKEQPINLIDMGGGNKRNAIPREAYAVVGVKDVDALKRTVSAVVEDLKYEYEGIEDNIHVEYEDAEGGEGFSAGATKKLLALLYAFPHGYLAFNPHMKDLVDTSTNLASIAIDGDRAVIITSSRSSMTTARDAVREMLAALGYLVGAEVKMGGSYPSWKPNVNSELLKVVKEAYTGEFGKDPEVKAIHAGLETAIIGEHFPGMDMVSIGPQIEFPHSPDERVEINSVANFWRFVRAVLKGL